ncbi:MAG: hypothetical protein ABIS39_03050 [Sphingomicrobium sp.]
MREPDAGPKRWGGMVMLALLAAAAAASAPTPLVSDSAAGLIERDWVIHQWALKAFDRDGDRVIAPAEARAAAAELRAIADGNGDGRVTPAEYRAARAFILARY